MRGAVDKSPDPATNTFGVEIEHHATQAEADDANRVVLRPERVCFPSPPRVVNEATKVRNVAPSRPWLSRRRWSATACCSARRRRCTPAVRRGR
jgi:hypothetical protein